MLEEGKQYITANGKRVYLTSVHGDFIGGCLVSRQFFGHAAGEFRASRWLEWSLDGTCLTRGSWDSTPLQQFNILMSREQEAQVCLS